MSEIPKEDKNIVVTYGDSILTNIDEIQFENDISNCTIEEADQRIIRHVINCVKNNFTCIVVCTGDTDVLILLISIVPLLQELSSCKLFCKFGLGENLKWFDLNNICEILGNDVCKSLPFFHAFTGCDTVSSFFNHSKIKFFDAWMKYDDKLTLTQIFEVLGNEPMEVHDDQIRVLEKYILSIYFPKIEITGDINIDRMNSFRKIPNGNLRLIPFCRFGLLEHTKRACIQSGWLWRQGLKNLIPPNPIHWGWCRKNEKFVPRWQSGEPSLTVEDICIVCSCTATCKSCKCTRKNMKCIPYCRCGSKCQNT